MQVFGSLVVELAFDGVWVLAVLFCLEIYASGFVFD
jgi:hypothetical protein